MADCKLATNENLAKISRWGGLFVSVMPRTWKEDETFRQKVRHGNIKWQHILSRPNNRNPHATLDRYYKAQGDYITSSGYQLYWIRSTQKAEQDKETRSRRIQTSLEALKKLQTKLNKYSLKGPKQIDTKIRAILKEHHCIDFIAFDIHESREYKNLRRNRGRPRKDERGQVTWKNIYSITFDVHADAIAREKKVDGVFPLITNLDTARYRAKRVLEIYKFQPFIEKRHSQIKTYQEVTPVNLKKSERVVGYLHMQIMALMVATLIERQLRKAMRRNSISSLPLYPEDRKCYSPTMFDIVRFFRGVERYEVYEGDSIKIFPAQLNTMQTQVLKLLDVPLSLYE